MEDYCDVCANNETEACANCFEANKFLFECPSCAEKDAVIAEHEAVMRELAKMVNELWNYDHSGIWDTEENIISEARRRAVVKG